MITAKLLAPVALVTGAVWGPICVYFLTACPCPPGAHLGDALALALMASFAWLGGSGLLLLPGVFYDDL